jgi:hypothetical protein
MIGVGRGNDHTYLPSIVVALVVQSTAGGEDRMRQVVFGLIEMLAMGAACAETYSFTAATEANRYGQAVADSPGTRQPGTSTVRKQQIGQNQFSGSKDSTPPTLDSCLGMNLS